MARRFAGTLATLVVGIAIGTAATGMLVAQQPAQPPATAAGRRAAARFGAPAGPCGPQGQLAAEFVKERRSEGALLRGPACTPWTRREWARARSTAASTSCISASASRKWRSSRSTAPQIIGVWQHLGNPDTLVWMLAYRDRAHREDVWAKFAADPDWKALSSKYSVPIGANVFTMSATDYSPLK